MLRALIIVIVTAVAMTTALACQPQAHQPQDVGAKAVAALIGTEGSAMGTVTLTQTPHGVLVAADVTGLEPGGHGFHIHAIGTCTPDFSAAGDHFNPYNIGHGLNHPDGVHPGDMPNIYAGADGNVRADYFTDTITLDADVGHTLFDADGSAIIIHEKPDSYGADPGAGARIACGVITRY